MAIFGLCHYCIYWALYRFVYHLQRHVTSPNKPKINKEMVRWDIRFTCRFWSRLQFSGGMIPCWLVTTDVKNVLDVLKWSVILHPVSHEELPYVNAILLIPFPELLHSYPNKNTSVTTLWYKFGTNIESATVKLISLHSNVSLKTTHAKYSIYYLRINPTSWREGNFLWCRTQDWLQSAQQTILYNFMFMVPCIIIYSMK